MKCKLFDYEHHNYNFEKHFISETRELLKNFSEVSNVKVKMDDFLTDGEFRAKIEAKFLGLKIVSSKVGNSFADLSEDIFNDLVGQIKLCRQWLR